MKADIVIASCILFDPGQGMFSIDGTVPRRMVISDAGTGTL